MKTGIRIITLLMLVWHTAAAQKVANFSAGTPGQKDYEQFSFWVRNNQRSTIEYVAGADRKGFTLQYGLRPLDGKGFNVVFPNREILTVVPEGTRLTVRYKNGKFYRSFRWQYEGPVNGIGTHCVPCAADPMEAMQLVNTYYMR